MTRQTQTELTAPGRVVILGSSGFIGSHLMTYFSKAGIETFGISSKAIDLSQPQADRALAEVIRKEDVVIFASCITREKGEDIPTFMKNLAMAQNVSLLLETQGCAHVVYLSSDAVYQDGLSLVREDSEIKPGGLYGLTHVAREGMVTYAAAKAKIPLTILRPCAVYGKGDTHNGYGPNRFLKTATEEGKISLFGEGEERRDHIYVGDVCRLMDLCIKHHLTGILNLATGKSHSFGEVAQTVQLVLSKSFSIEGSPRRSPITHRHFDITALCKVFPSFSFTTLEQGLREVVNN